MAGQVATRTSMDALSQDEYARPARVPPKKGKKGRGKRGGQKKSKAAAKAAPRSYPSPIAQAMGARC